MLYTNMNNIPLWIQRLEQKAGNILYVASVIGCDRQKFDVFVFAPDMKQAEKNILDCIGETVLIQDIYRYV
jgi:hypothetical protein